MNLDTCTNCGLPTEPNEHHVRVSYGDAAHPGGCIRVQLDIYRSREGYISESRVIGTAPQRKAARIVPVGPITM